MRRAIDRTAWACAAVLVCAGLAGAATAAPECGYVPSLDIRTEPAEVAVDPRLLDAAVGFYRIQDYDLVDMMSVTREGDHLLATLIGRPPAILTPVGQDAFAFGPAFDQIVLETNGAAPVKRITWRRNHLRDLPMARIGDAEAAKLATHFAKRVDAGTGAPPSQGALLHLIEGLQSGKPDYGRMSIYLTMATHRQLTHLRPFLNDLGPVRSIQFLGFMGEGLNGVPGETYDVMQRDGVSRWHIAVDGKGVIAGADVSCGP